MKLSLGSTIKQKTKNIDDKINNNNDPSQANKTSCDSKIKTVTDPNIEPSGTGSDTGTYTVENEEDGQDLRVEGEEFASTESTECRKEVVGLKNEDVDTGSSEWVSEWASKTTSMEVRCVS